MNQGDYFGEVALIFNCKRTATIISTNYCTFAKIEKQLYLKSQQSFLNTVKSQTINYIDKSKKFKIKLLKQIEYFESYDLEDFSMFFDEVQYQMNLEEFEENVEII